MSFKTKVQSDALTVFLNTDEFAESIQYTPYGQAAKVIKAIVVRDRIDADTQAQSRIPRGRCEISISTDAVSGIAVVNKGRDKANFPAVLGGVSTDWVVVDVMGKDNGMWQLQLSR